MARPERAYKIKYSILPDNIEYLDIIYKKRHLKRYGKELAGTKWKDFQELVGKDLNLNDRFYYNILFSDGNKASGSTQAINFSIKPLETTMHDANSIKAAIESLEKKLSVATKEGGVTFDMLLQSTKAGHEAQVTYLTSQLREKDDKISELKAEIKELEHDLDEYEKQITELEGKSGWVGILNQYKPMIEAGLMKLGAKGPHPAKLGESDPSGIPAEVLQILGTVDYDKLKTQPDQYNQILNYLRQYVSVLPQKGKD
jgi:hypothetical protein